MTTIILNTIKYYIPAMLIAGIFFSCKNDINEVRKLTEGDDLPVQSTFNGVYTYTDSGLVQTVITAPVLDKYIENDTLQAVFTQGLHVDFYSSDGEEITSTLDADYGIWLEGEGKMIVRKNVKFQNYKNERLETEELTWERANKKVYTEMPVSIYQDEGVIHGVGLDATEDFSSYTLRQITGVIEVEDEF